MCVRLGVGVGKAPQRHSRNNDSMVYARGTLRTTKVVIAASRDSPARPILGGEGLGPARAEAASGAARCPRPAAPLALPYHQPPKFSCLL